MLVEQLKVSDEASNENSIDNDKGVEDVNTKYDQYSKVELLSLCRERKIQKTGNMKTLRQIRKL